MAVNAVEWLKKIAGKFPKTKLSETDFPLDAIIEQLKEGILAWAKSELLELKDIRVQTANQYVETDPIDFTKFRGAKLIFIKNGQDVDVYVDVLVGVSPDFDFVPLRENILVPKGGMKVIVSNGTTCPTYVKFRFRSPEPASSGVVSTKIVRWGV